MKNKTTAGLLALFLGGCGAHHFYLGNNKKGLTYLLVSFLLFGKYCVPLPRFVKHCAVFLKHQQPTHTSFLTTKV